MKAGQQNPYMLCYIANDLYQNGLSSQAAETYKQAVEQARAANDTRCLVHALRWTGNAYMWAYRHDEAYPYLLQAVSFDGQPEAPLEDIYGAMTDLCMLSVRSRPYAMLRQFLAETREFLARRDCGEWDHRVDLLAAMGHLRRGEAAEAYRLACRAWQRQRVATGGPHYQQGAYLNILYRAAHGLHDRRAMNEARRLMIAEAEKTILMSRLRLNNCLAMHAASDDAAGTSGREMIAALAEETVGMIKATEWVRDEAIEAIRLLALAGEDAKARATLDRSHLVEAADTALLRLDLAICQLASHIDWQPPLYRPPAPGEVPPAPLLNGNDLARQLVAGMLEAALREARIEDARLESDACVRAVRRRQAWLRIETTEEDSDEEQACA